MRGGLRRQLGTTIPWKGFRVPNAQASIFISSNLDPLYVSRLAQTPKETPPKKTFYFCFVWSYSGQSVGLVFKSPSLGALVFFIPSFVMKKKKKKWAEAVVFFRRKNDIPVLRHLLFVFKTVAHKTSALYGRLQGNGVLMTQRVMNYWGF